MQSAQQELEDLLAELEQVETRMLAMQYRVAQLKRATREVRPAQPSTGRDREALRKAAKRMEKLSEEQSGARKRNLH